MSSLASFSPRRAALAAGLAFVVSVVFAVAVDDVLLANFVPPGDATTLSADIRSNPSRLGPAALGYLIVLLLDCIIALGLFAVLRSAGVRLAAGASILRIVYAAIVGGGVIALSFEAMDAFQYSATKDVAYVFFVLHLLALGLAIFRARYLPNIFGMGLLIGAFAYSVFFMDLEPPEIVNVAAMFTMALAELSFFVWLIFRRRRLPA